ncbi:MAG: phosphomannomutase/phosphoglucomutase [Sphingomonadales bacterium]|jgi:phosphomannomutase
MGHKFHNSVLREYDVRGIVGETLSVKDAYALGQAFGTKLRSTGGKTVVVGRDGRASSPEFAERLIEGLISTGVDVFDVGLGPTPMTYFSVYELGADGGIMVTGSHNPSNYNGFKMMLGRKAFFGDQIQELGRIAAAGEFATDAGSVKSVDVQSRYVARLLRDYEGKPLSVAWDPGNGAAGRALEELVQHLPGRHEVINGEIDGSFPNHHPDPTVEKNLEQLKQLVREKGLDLGIAFDGDGDRIGAVDAQGRVVWGDQLLAILSRDVLADQPGSTIIADVKASQALFDEIGRLGGDPVMWKTGHSLIKSKMAECGAPLAGEMSGHIFFSHRFYGFDDALYAAIRLLNAVSNHGGSLAALRDELPDMINTPELRFDCPDEKKFGVVADVVARLREKGADFSDIDGARVNTEDGWWLLRASNTQAVLVARAEGHDEAALERLKAQLVEVLAQSGISAPEGL